MASSSSSSNQTVEAQLNHLRALGARVIQLRKELTDEVVLKEWFLASMAESSSRDDCLKELEEMEKSLTEELNASVEKNLEYERKIADLQKGMAEQRDLYQILATEWAKEKDLLESQNSNLKTNVSAANKSVYSSKKLVGELSMKLKVLDAKILEKETEFRSKMERNEEKLRLLTQVYESSVDTFDALLRRVKRFEFKLDQGLIDQMRATIRSLKKKLEGQRMYNTSVDARRADIIVELQHQNENLEGDVMLLDDLSKTMMG